MIKEKVVPEFEYLIKTLNPEFLDYLFIRELLHSAGTIHRVMEAYKDQQTETIIRRNSQFKDDFDALVAVLDCFGISEAEVIQYIEEYKEVKKEVS